MLKSNSPRKTIYYRGQKLTIGMVKQATEQFLHNKPHAMQQIVSYLYENDMEGLETMTTVISNSLGVKREMVWEDLRGLVYQ